MTQLLSFLYNSSYLAHPAPHDPLLVEARHEDECSHIVNRWLPLAKDLLRARRLTCALVAGVDEGVGLLKERLARAGVLDDTVTGINKRKVVDAFSPRSLSSPRITAGCLMLGLSTTRSVEAR